MRPARRHTAPSSSPAIAADSRDTSRSGPRASARAARPRRTESKWDPPRVDPLIGTIDGFRVGALVGEGSACVVFEAVRETDGAIGVIKLLRSAACGDVAQRRALRREAEALRACANEGVPALLGDGTLPDGSPYIAMERVRGESLAHYVGRRGRLDVVAAVSLVQRVAGILGRIHAAGYVHCDLKPDHIFVAAGAAGTLDVHVVDFGAAQRIGERSATPGFVVGTPRYMAPEQAAAVADLDARADVYALGAILYELLSGRPLLSGSNAFAMITRLLSETPPRLALVAPKLSLALDRVVGSAIEREREHRCRTALAFAIALVPHARDRIEAERRLAAALHPRPAPERDRAAAMR